MLEAGRPVSQRIFQLSAAAQPDATCKYFALKLVHNAMHTQAWSRSPCLHTIPRDRASEFILIQTLAVWVGHCTYVQARLL